MVPDDVAVANEEVSLVDVALATEDVDMTLAIAVELEASAGDDADADVRIEVGGAATVDDTAEELCTDASELVVLGEKELESGVVDGGEELVLGGADDEEGGELGAGADELAL